MSMKIKPEHLQHMRLAISAKLHEVGSDVVAEHRIRISTEAHSHVQDLDKRMRWDMLRASGLITWVCDTLYKYANDTHIDTALKAIQAEFKF